MRRPMCAAVLATIMGATASADELTDRAITALKAALPGSDVAVADQRMLKVRSPNGPEFSVALENIGRVCAGDAAGCPRAMDEFARKVAATMATPNPVHTRAQLRAVIRGKDYLDAMSAQMKEATTPTVMVSRPLVGDLVEACYFDLDQGMSPATEDDIAKLGLDRSQAFTLCEKNVHAALPALSGTVKFPAKGFGVLAGNAYSSSYFVFHDDWAPLAAKIHGALIVSVPESDAVIFMEEYGPEAAPALSHAAAEGMKTAQRPVSDEVLRWTKNGWDIAN